MEVFFTTDKAWMSIIIHRVTSVAVLGVFLLFCSCQVAQPVRPDSSTLSSSDIPSTNLVPCEVASHIDIITQIRNQINVYRTANGKQSLLLDEVLSAAMMQSAFDAERNASLNLPNISSFYAQYMQANGCQVDQNLSPAFQLPAYVSVNSESNDTGANALAYWTTNQTPFTQQYIEALMREDVEKIVL
jgi:hypothetical protein